MLERIGKYEIRLQIGRGAMGTVYEGFDPVIGRRVAIKTLRTEMFETRQLPEVLVRFKREAQSAGRLSHPHIVTIHEFGEEQGTPYIVMEYMSGTELGHRLESGSRFTLEEVVRIVTQLLGALTHAHEHGVVHRDLKPANMFLLGDGSLKVVDFGIARVEASDLTGTGAMLGTPAYMSPEQCLGLQVDHRSDLFSAGVILYQLLTGDKPFTGSVTTTIQKVLRQEPIAPSELNPTLSPAWDKVVARAMAKKPEARYESARQFAEAVKTAFTAERAHEDAGRRKAADSEEHANRAAEERLRAESVRRADDERREVQRRAQAEIAARNAADASVRKDAEERTLAMRKPAVSRALAIAAAVVVALAGLGAVLYTRQSADEQAAKVEAARVAAEAQARIEADKRAKAEALAREEGGKRLKLEADAAKKEADAKRDAEAAAKARAEEEAKKAAEEKTKALVLKKEEDERKKAELAAKKDAEAKARADAEANKKAEELAKKEAEEKAKAAALAKQEAEEKAKADAAKKAEAARRAAPRAGSTFRDCEGCPEMVVISAGSFLMGSPSSEEGRNSDEGPQRQVSIPRPFAVGKYEVTFDEWEACVRENGCSHRPGDFGWGRGRRPAIDVSWHDAKQYAEWLTRKTGKRYRLLTEAEWEYVARAGTTTPFSTGATITTSQANYGDSRNRTAPVGSYGANAFGLFDIHGNVWEWTEDCWNENYNGAPSDGSAWLTGDCSRRVVRGGSWYALPFFVRSAVRGGSFDDHPRSVRSALRHGDTSSVRLRFFGFRLARTLE